MRLARGLLLSAPLLLLSAEPAERGGWRLDNEQRAAVRLFWRLLYRDAPASGYWRGNLATCDAGETLPQHRAAMLARINWFRAMAGLPADLEEDPATSRKVQAAALVMAANGRIAHRIDASWRCYSDEAAEGAQSALLGSGENGPPAIDEFMRDGGPNNTAVNHRRWLLYPQTRFVGLGDVPQSDRARAAAGMTAFDGLYAGNRPLVKHGFVAWPPPGWVPYQVVYPRWSFSLDGADFSAATVSLQRDGLVLSPVREEVALGAGEPTLVWHLPGMATDAAWPRPDGDQQYQVSIGNVKLADGLHQYAYTVRIFDPAGPVAMDEAQIHGQAGRFSVSLPAGATGSEWRALRLQAWPLAEGAEQGYGAFAYSGSNRYPVLQSQTVATGRQAFRLAHPQIGDETLLLAQTLIPGPQAVLQFSSRLGVAGADEDARVEIRRDGETAWHSLLSMPGRGEPKQADSEFHTIRLDLSAYAQRLVQLRFRYQFTQGDYFAPDDPRVGWFLDDIRLTDAWQVREASEPQTTAEEGFSFSPAEPASWRLQARPTLFGVAGDWGSLWAPASP